MDRRDFLKSAALLGAGFAVSPWTWPQPPPALAAGGCLWGAYARPRGLETPQQAILNLEASIGRSLAITRHYVPWNRALPGKLIEWAVDTGHTPYISWQSWLRDGSPVSWSSIARGDWDQWIKTQARRVGALGSRVYLAFDHEPENDDACGTASQFRSAFDRVSGIFDANGAANVTWLCVLTTSTYLGGSGGPGAWLPDGADLLGVDGYNRWPCMPEGDFVWESFRSLFAAARDFARTVGAGLVVAEYGCVEQDACHQADGDPNAKARWFANAGEAIKDWPQIDAVVYSHTRAQYRGFTENYWVDTSPHSLAAFKAVGLDPYLA